MSALHTLRSAAGRARSLPVALWRRGGVELGIVGVAAALLVGAVVGTGAASTFADVSDGLTWVGDDAAGTIVQIDPTTGRPQNPLQVAAPGSDLEISQTDGNLVVTDERTGQVTAIDLATLLAGGRRSGPPAGKTKVLVGGGTMVLADLGSGTVRRVDPRTMGDIGEPLQLGPLADAVMDAAGVLWTVGTDSHARSARYSDGAGRFVVASDRQVDGAGAGSALVPHDNGVTLFGPAGGVAVQIGTRDDVAALVPTLSGAVLAATGSPADLVPVTMTDAGRVVILSGGRASTVDVSGLGCERPGRPTVFRGDVYVPCLGAGRVLVLGPDGSRAAPDLVTPGGGDPKILLDDGRMVVSTPGAASAVVVGADGRSTPVTVRDPAQPVRNPGDAPTPPSVPPLPPVLRTTPPVTSAAPVPTAATTTPPPGATTASVPAAGSTSGPVTTVRGGGPGAGDTPGGGRPADTAPPTGAPTTGAPTSGAPAVTLDPPTGVSATARGPNAVLVSWTPGASGADSYLVQRSGGGVGTTATGEQTTASVSGLGTGTFTFTVSAVRGGATARSAPSAPVVVGATTTAPGTTAPPVATTTPPPPASPPPATTAPPATTVAPPPATTEPPAATTPPPAPQPQVGDAVVTGVSGYATVLRANGKAPVDVTLDPPGPWASWGGGCELHYSLPGSVVGAQAISCAATSATLQVSSADGEATVFVRALVAGGGSLDSASVTGYVTVEYQPSDPCTGIPYAVAPAAYQPAGAGVVAPGRPIDCQPYAVQPASSDPGGGSSGYVWAFGLVGAAALVRYARTGSLLPARTSTRDPQRKRYAR